MSSTSRVMDHAVGIGYGTLQGHIIFCDDTGRWFALESGGATNDDDGDDNDENASDTRDRVSYRTSATSRICKHDWVFLCTPCRLTSMYVPLRDHLSTSDAHVSRANAVQRYLLTNVSSAAAVQAEQHVDDVVDQDKNIRATDTWSEFYRKCGILYPSCTMHKPCCWRFHCGDASASVSPAASTPPTTRPSVLLSPSLEHGTWMTRLPNSMTANLNDGESRRALDCSDHLHGALQGRLHPLHVTDSDNEAVVILQHYVSFGQSERNILYMDSCARIKAESEIAKDYKWARGVVHYWHNVWQQRYRTPASFASSHVAAVPTPTVGSLRTSSPPDLSAVDHPVVGERVGDCYYGSLAAPSSSSSAVTTPTPSTPMDTRSDMDIDRLRRQPRPRAIDLTPLSPPLSAIHSRSPNGRHRRVLALRRARTWDSRLRLLIAPSKASSVSVSLTVSRASDSTDPSGFHTSTTSSATTRTTLLAQSSQSGSMGSARRVQLLRIAGQRIQTLIRLLDQSDATAKKVVSTSLVKALLPAIRAPLDLRTILPFGSGPACLAVSGDCGTNRSSSSERADHTEANIVSLTSTPPPTCSVTTTAAELSNVMMVAVDTIGFFIPVQLLPSAKQEIPSALIPKIALDRLDSNGKVEIGEVAQIDSSWQRSVMHDSFAESSSVHRHHDQERQCMQLQRVKRSGSAGNITFDCRPPPQYYGIVINRSTDHSWIHVIRLYHWRRTGHVFSNEFVYRRPPSPPTSPTLTTTRTTNTIPCRIEETDDVAARLQPMVENPMLATADMNTTLDESSVLADYGLDVNAKSEASGAASPSSRISWLIH